jgi:L-ascorbate metabolism protein UlaG (beta-lactamase superfamily)
MTAKDAVELCSAIQPNTIVPIHYEGWKHFRQGREDAERDFAVAPAEVRSKVRWVPIGEAVEL